MKIAHSSCLFAATLMVALGCAQSFAQSPPPQRFSPTDLVNALHTTFGNHHARAVHTKGIVLEGTFTPDKEAAALTKAWHFQNVPSQVVVRFSNFTGIPDIPDNLPTANPRGMAIKFSLPDGSNTDMVCHSFNGFPTATSDEFREFLLSIAASGPGAVKPTALEKFLDTHSVAKTFLTTQRTPASYGAIRYFGVNAFKFTNAQGVSNFIRYRLTPVAGEELVSAEELPKLSPQYLHDEIAVRVAKGPISLKLHAQVAEKGDDIENPSAAWPEARRQVLLGTVKIEKLASNSSEADKRLTFNPGNLPAGIEMADAMSKFRAAAYPVSVKERQE